MPARQYFPRPLVIKGAQGGTQLDDLTVVDLATVGGLLTAQAGITVSGGNGLFGTSTARAVGGRTALVQVEATGAAGGAASSWLTNSTSGVGSYLTLAASRGAAGTPTAVLSTDPLGTLDFAGADGTDYATVAARIRGVAVGTIAGDRVPGQLEFSTGTNASPSVLTLAMTIDNTQNVLVGTTTAATGSPRLDVVGAQGFFSGATTVTNLVQKDYRWTVRHYTNAEENLMVILGVAGAAANTIGYGGGNASFNAATKHEWYTAATTTTVTGTLAMDLTGVGATSTLRTVGHLEIDADLNHDGSNIGFFGTAPAAKQTGVAVTAAAIHAALVTYGLISA